MHKKGEEPSAIRTRQLPLYWDTPSQLYYHISKKHTLSDDSTSLFYLITKLYSMGLTYEKKPRLMSTRDHVLKVNNRSMNGGLAKVRQQSSVTCTPCPTNLWVIWCYQLGNNHWEDGLSLSFRRLLVPIHSISTHRWDSSYIAVSTCDAI